MITEEMFADYVNTAETLADQVASNIKNNSKIDNDTVIALNNFIKASLAIKDLTDEIKKHTITLN